MTPNIKVLEDHLIDKIAAGEVIERPYSIVKELIENAIDAGARNISIEIKNGGISLIKIIDDGHGIKKSQVKTAFLRHATSKLKEFEDLNFILTLGFRGEALSSIASIAQVEMITKYEEEDIGTKIIIEGGKIISEEDFAYSKGTTFIIKNIFFNTPARKKFLKKDSVESSYISDIINRFAIGNPKISFKYINNGSVILQTSGNGDLKTVLFYVYGKEISEKTLEVSNSKDGFVLKGLVCSPSISRGNRSYGNIFINGRYIKSKLIQSAIEEAFEGKLMHNKFPIYAINIIIPANKVDVNVHPTKMEVRFENENFIFNFIKQSIEKILKENIIIPEFTYKENNDTTLNLNDETYSLDFQKDIKQEFLNKQGFKGNVFYVEETSENEHIEEEIDSLFKENSFNEIPFIKNDSFKDFYKEKNKNYNKTKDNDDFKISNFEVNKQEDIQKNLINYNEDNFISNKKVNEENIRIINNDTKENNELQDIKSIFNNYKIIGQIFNTYWIIEKDENIFIIDQHALHEKYLYENLIKDVKSQKVVSQPLVNSYTINVNEIEKSAIENNLELLKNFGFIFEDFGKNSYIIREVPVIFNLPLNPSFFLDIVNTLLDKNVVNIYDLKLDKIASISCKAAIKGNNKLSTNEAMAMIESIMSLENPFNCPHGRPTIIKFTKYEIEKMFKRIQN